MFLQSEKLKLGSFNKDDVMKKLLMLGACMLLGACETVWLEMPLEGSYNEGEKFNGAVKVSDWGDVLLFAGSAEAMCYGGSEVDEATATNACNQQTGTGELQCSDGRLMTVTWQATGCMSGVGVGTDDLGQSFSFWWGVPPVREARAEKRAK